MGESEKAVREVFRKARQAAPTILFFDEIDSLVPVRGTGDSSHVSERVLGQFLSEMDGIEELKGVLVLAATNRLDLLDTALIRPGRFERVLEFGLPDKPTRFEILKIHTRGKPLDKTVDLHALAEATEGKTGADLEGLLRRASLAAMGEFLRDQEGEKAPPTGSLKITGRHFEEAQNG